MGRQEFTMTQAQRDALVEASKPVPYMVVGGAEPRSPQENANDAWRELGKELGFKHMTVQPGCGDPLCFTAEAIVVDPKGA